MAAHGFFVPISRPGERGGLAVHRCHPAADGLHPYAVVGPAHIGHIHKGRQSFYWRDTLPAEVRLDSIVTGTYNFPGTYKITYRVNGGEYRTLADNLSTRT